MEFVLEEKKENQPKKKTTKKMSAIYRMLISTFVVFFTIMAGHLFMIVINEVEYAQYGESFAESAEIIGTYYGEAPLLETIENQRVDAHTPEDIEAFEELYTRVEAGESVEIKMMPVTPISIWATGLLLVLGLGMLLWTRRFKSDAIQSLIGMFAGNFIWTSTEYALMIASRQLGIYKSLHALNGEVYGAFGEYVLIKYTWTLLAAVMIYFLFIESSRCPFFLWFRKKLPIMRGKNMHGRIDNYGPRTAFQYLTIIWAAYIALLWAYDEAVFGVHSWMTNLLFFGSLSYTAYLMLRLYRKPTFGTSLRYSIGVIIIFFTAVEIAAKWGILSEPWVILTPINAIIFFGGTFVGAVLFLRELKTGKREKTSKAVV